MSTKGKLIMTAFLAGGFIAGCKTSGPGSAAESKIVQEVQAAGAGQLDQAAESAIQGWLGQHLDVAKRIGPECNVVMKNATANWSTSTEGRVCTAAAHVLFVAPKDILQVLNRRVVATLMRRLPRIAIWIYITVLMLGAFAPVALSQNAAGLPSTQGDPSGAFNARGLRI